MKVAIYARTSPADTATTVEEILAELRAYASQRGWLVDLECFDRAYVGKRPGLQRMVAAVRARRVQAVVVRSLAQVARSLRHLVDLGTLLVSHSVVLVAVADRVDSSDPIGSIRWNDWLLISREVARQIRCEAAKVARAGCGAWGRVYVAVNPSELLSLWEGRGGRRPLSQRQIAARLGVSTPTVRRRLQELRSEGKLDDGARAEAIAVRGGIRRGGRRLNPLDDEKLRQAWADPSLAVRIGAAPSIYAVALHLRVRRSRVAARLHELGLLKRSKG